MVFLQIDVWILSLLSVKNDSRVITCTVENNEIFYLFHILQLLHLLHHKSQYVCDYSCCFLSGLSTLNFYFQIFLMKRVLFSMYRGRGIWRCLYDPNLSLLITAGFDSAIKVHRPHAFLSRGLAEAQLSHERTEMFSICIPNVLEYIGLTDRLDHY